MDSTNNLPEEIQTALKLVTGILEQNQIKYWLGGGLFQLIIQDKYDSINENYKDHDIDLHILDSQKNVVFELLKNSPNLQDVNFYSAPSGKIVKIAFKVNGLSVETPILFGSPDDPNVVFYISWGKKENWPLSTDTRQRFYYFSFPREIFLDDILEIGDLKIRVPKMEYVKLLYK